MPIQYSTGPVAEHRLVRASCGLFDVSHMGRFVFTGTDAGEFLNRLISCKLTTLNPMQSAYGLLCREDGGVLDDVFVYRLADSWLVVVNAANTDRDYSWFQEHLTGDVRLSDRSDELAMLAFQGPGAIRVLDRIAEQIARPSDMRRFDAAELMLGGLRCTVGRTGYTGEDGVELFVAAADVENLWNSVLDEADAANVACGPVGLAARDSLRFEPGFPLYGHELVETRSPLPARLKWACDLEGDFIGAEAIRRELERGISPKLATIEMIDRGVPREGQPVYSGTDLAGNVASGMYAPTIDRFCANVFVKPQYAPVGTEVEIEIRDNRKRAVVVKRPLYRPAYKE